MRSLPRVLIAVCMATWVVNLYAAQDDVRVEPGGQVETRREENPRDTEPEEAGTEEKRFDFTVETSIHYDSNPEVSSDDEEDDWGDVLKLSALVRFVDTEQVEAGGLYSFYGEFYSDVDERDLMGHTVGLYVSRIANPVSVRLDYQFAHFLVDSESYLRKHTVAPMLFWGSSAKTLEMLRFSASSNDYPEDENLDGSDWSLQVRHFHFLDAEKKKRCSIGYKYTDTEADDSDEDNVSHRVSTDLNVPLPRDMTMLTRLSYTAKEYGGGRDDEKLGYRVEFAKPLSSTWTLIFGHDGTNNDSDDPVADYRRNITFLSIRGSF
jgi:hypothetical protein